MSLADQKLDTMPVGTPAKGFGVDVNGQPVLFEGWRVLAMSSVAITAPADTTENTLATVTLPGGALGPNGQCRITTMWTTTNNANTKTLRTKFGGTTIGAIAQTTNVSLRDQRQFGNRGDQASQVATTTGTTTGFGPSTAAVTTMTLDTTVNQSVTITAQKADGADTARLEMYLVEVVYGS